MSTQVLKTYAEMVDGKLIVVTEDVTDQALRAKPTLHMTVGLPRSGKSTWAKSTGLPIVNPDSIRLALHGNAFLSDAEAMVWAIAKYMVKALFLAGHQEVILDATNTTQARRDEWKSKMWERSFYCVNTPKEECLVRAQAEGNTALIPIIEKMANQLQLPTAEERNS